MQQFPAYHRQAQIHPGLVRTEELMTQLSDKVTTEKKPAGDFYDHRQSHRQRASAGENQHRNSVARPERTALALSLLSRVTLNRLSLFL